MDKVCKKHQINPARIYGQCIGCELDSLRNSVEVAKLHRQNENLERLRAERDRDEARQANSALLEELDGSRKPRPLEEWHEDYGSTLWWKFPIEEPPYCGTPLDSDWPDYHTHWTAIIDPQYDTAPKEDKTDE